MQNEKDEAFDEFIQDYKKERYNNLVKKLIPYILGISFLVVITVSIQSWLNNKHLDKVYTNSAKFVDALASNTLDSTAIHGTKIESLINLILVQNNFNKNKDLNLYKNLQSDDDKFVSQHAKLKILSAVINSEIQMEKHEIDSLFSSLKTGPFKNIANLYQISWLIRKGENDAALEIFTKIKEDAMLPQEIKEIAQSLFL